MAAVFVLRPSPPLKSHALIYLFKKTHGELIIAAISVLGLPISIDKLISDP